MGLRDWRLHRVLALGVLWIVGVVIVLVERSIAFARQVQPQPTGDFYVVFLHLPGGLWMVFGPPVVLVMIWLAVRRSRI